MKSRPICFRGANYFSKRSAPARTRGHVGQRLLALVASAALMWASAATELAAQAGAAGEQQVLRVGTSGDYPPFSRAGEGFDVEVAKLLARDLGYRIQWVAFRWPQLQEMVEANAFDVAMSGITWRAHRAVSGRMSRAVALGGPCVLSKRPAGRVAVNRGGILERWARSRFRPEQIRTVDKNLSLPLLLQRDEVDAIVTDRFEIRHFRSAGLSERCEPARDRKVYWVSPARAQDLGPRVDRWLREHEPQLAALKRKWFGAGEPRSDVEHLVDLLGRRLALMPAVAAYKRDQGIAIEDRAREAKVLAQAVQKAKDVGLRPASVRKLFRLQIELAKDIQKRSTTAEPLDLHSQLRPTLSTLGQRIAEALAQAAPALPKLRPQQLALLQGQLSEQQLKALCTALRAVRPAAPRGARAANASPQQTGLAGSPGMRSSSDT